MYVRMNVFKNIVAWLFGFYGLSTFVGYLMLIHFMQIIIWISYNSV